MPTVARESPDGSASLRREAGRILDELWRGRSTVPSATLYPHQWSWDSAFIAIGNAHRDQQRAETELVSLFEGQWDDGRVPHIVFNPEVAEEAYFPGPGFWRSDRVEGVPAVPTSGIVQPPVHARAVLHVVRRAADPYRALRFAERLYPRLCAGHRYLEERRIAGRTGLAAVLHPWETGLDNSPMWDAPLARVPVDPTVWDRHTRRDLDHADRSERPGDDDYARYIRLAEAYRDARYDDRAYLPDAEFTVVDPLFNALWAWSEEALAELAPMIGADPRPHRERAAALTDALVRALFDDDLGMFVALDARAGEPIRRRTVGGLVPLVLSGLPRRPVDAICDRLASPHFGLLDPGVTGVPSYDLQAADFDGHRYWRGPTWINTNWLLWCGLRRHGRDEPAAALAHAMRTLVATAGFHEYFDPRLRTGHGAAGFGWTAALLVDLLETG